MLKESPGRSAKTAFGLRIRLAVLALILLSIQVGLSCVTEKETMRVECLDSFGEPIEGATVSIEGGASVKTDAHGFALIAVVKHEFKVAVSMGNWISEPMLVRRDTLAQPLRITIPAIEFVVHCAKRRIGIWPEVLPEVSVLLDGEELGFTDKMGMLRARQYGLHDGMTVRLVALPPSSHLVAVESVHTIVIDPDMSRYHRSFYFDRQAVLEMKPELGIHPRTASGVAVSISDSSWAVPGITDSLGYFRTVFPARPENSIVDIEMEKAGFVVRPAKPQYAIAEDTIRITYRVTGIAPRCTLKVYCKRDDGTDIDGGFEVSGASLTQPVSQRLGGEAVVRQGIYDVRVMPDPGQGVSDTTAENLSLRGLSSHSLDVVRPRIPTPCGADYTLGKEAAEQGDMALATMYYEQACQSANPMTDVECFLGAHLALVDIRMSDTPMKNIPEAARRLGAVLEYYPAIAKAHYRFGQILMMGQDWQQAASEFMEVVSLCEQLPPETCCQARYNLGDCYYRWSSEYTMIDPRRIGKLREAWASLNGITKSQGCPEKIRGHAGVLATRVAEELQGVGIKVGD